MQKKRILPPTFFNVSIIALIAFHILIPLSRIILFPWNLLGLIPIALGAVLNLKSDKDFKTAGTTVKPFEESSVLITTGVFRISRNPMYLGMVLILLGAAILLGSLSPYVVMVAFALSMHFLFIVPEEKMLESRFGMEYRQYKEHVRQWI
jgi:protein-S-isoprenylcysteine O-methyltransferase Ste14